MNPLILPGLFITLIATFTNIHFVLDSFNYYSLFISELILSESAWITIIIKIVSDFF